MSKSKPARRLDKGEGNREADRHYRKAAKEFANSDEVEEAAREAADTVEEEERDAQRERPGRRS